MNTAPGPDGVPSDSPHEPAAAVDSDATPAVSLGQLFTEIANLWDVDVEGTEMAVRFEP